MNYRNKKEFINFLDKLKIFIKGQIAVVADEETLNIGEQTAESMIFGESLNLSHSGNKLSLIIEPNFNMHSPLKILIRNINQIEKIIDQSAKQHGVTVVLEGPYIKIRDYYNISLNTLWKFSIMLFSSFFILMIMFFRSMILPAICCFISLLIIIWVFGVYSFFIEGISFISIFVITLFILISISNCIIMSSSFLAKTNEESNVRNYINKIFYHFIPSMIIGSLIIGLSVIIIFPLYGIVWKEWVLITGISMIIATLLSFLVTGVAIIITRKSEMDFILSESTHSPVWLLSIKPNNINKYQWWSIVSIFIMSIYFLYQSMQIKFDISNPLSDENRLKTINIQNELIDIGDIYPSTIYFIENNLDTVRYMTEKIRKTMPDVKMESITDYLPDKNNDQYRFHYLRKLRKIVNSREIRRKISSHDIKMYHLEMKRLEANIIELQNSSYLGGQSMIYNKTVQLVGDGLDINKPGMLTSFVNSMDTTMHRVRLTYLQEKFSSALKSIVLKMANNEPLTIENLPLDIRKRFQGIEKKQFRINIYPNQEMRASLYYGEKLLDISKNITGWPIIVDELYNQINYYGDYILNYFIISILLFLFLYFRNIKYVLIISTSLFISCVWFLGMLSLFNINLNMMSISFIAILMYINVNVGVQIIQQWSKEKNIHLIYNLIKQSIRFLIIIIIIILLSAICIFHGNINITLYILCLSIICNSLAYFLYPLLLIENP